MDDKLLVKVLCRESATVKEILDRTVNDPRWLRIYDMYHNGSMSTHLETANVLGLSRPYCSITLKKINKVLYKNRIRSHDKKPGQFEAFPFRLWWDDMVAKGILTRTMDSTMIDVYRLNSEFNKAVMDCITHEHNPDKCIKTQVKNYYSDSEEVDLVWSMIYARWYNTEWNDKYKELYHEHEEHEHLKKMVCKRCNKNGLEVEIYGRYCEPCNKEIKRLDHIKKEADEQLERDAQDAEQKRKAEVVAKIKADDEAKANEEAKCERLNKVLEELKKGNNVQK